MLRGEHLTIDGLKKIVAIRACMNLGLSDELKKAFPTPDVVSVPRPLVKNQKNFRSVLIGWFHIRRRMFFNKNF